MNQEREAVARLQRFCDAEALAEVYGEYVSPLGAMRADIRDILALRSGGEGWRDEALAEIASLREQVKLERGRACTLLEAAYEAADWLGPHDTIADQKLVPAILKADGDPDYAREWAEDRGFFSKDAAAPSPSTHGEG